MPATIADITAGTRDAAVATWSSAAIAARYPAARDGSVEPAEGFFDAIADAQAVIDARAGLIGTERRRFDVRVAEVIWPAVSTGLPQLRLVDAEQAIDGQCLTARLELDLDAETTPLELFG